MKNRTHCIARVHNWMPKCILQLNEGKINVLVDPKASLRVNLRDGKNPKHAKNVGVILACRSTCSLSPSRPFIIFEKQHMYSCRCFLSQSQPFLMLLFSIESYAPFPTVTMQLLSKYMHNYISPNQRNNPNSQTLTWRQQGRKTPF